MRWREAPVGRPLELGPDTVAWPFDVDHIPGSIGWRIESGGLAVVFSGDTTYSAGLVAAAAGADLLIHEALATDADHDLAVSRLHSTSGDAGRAADRAAVGRLILTHLDNGFHENQAPLLEDAARHYAGRWTRLMIFTGLHWTPGGSHAGRTEQVGQGGSRWLRR